MKTPVYGEDQRDLVQGVPSAQLLPIKYGRHIVPLGEMLGVLLMTLVTRLAEVPIQDPLCNAELRQRVVLHLASCRAELGGVDVLAEDGIVTLRGELPLFYLRQLAVERARRVAGVRLVVDHIEVCTFPNGIHRTPK